LNGLRYFREWSIFASDTLRILLCSELNQWALCDRRRPFRSRFKGILPYASELFGIELDQEPNPA
jgi:hypothetical protein